MKKILVFLSLFIAALAQGQFVSSVNSTPTSNAVTISYSTPVSATTKVNYGTTTAYGTSSAVDAANTAHSVALPSLTPSTTYHFSVQATDSLGQVVNSVDYQFTTSAAVAVSVSPKTATVPSSGTQQFTSTVSGSSNTSVTWSATAGSVSSTGLFTAPAVTSTTTVTVKATSVADTTKSDTATVTVNPVVSVSIAPTTAVLQSGVNQQFTSTVTGSSNTSVTWTSSQGTVSSSGLFVAPTVATETVVTVKATSVADPSKSATASVTVEPATQAPSLGFVQSNYVNAGSTASPQVGFLSGQTAGNTNVVVVGWDDTTHTISSVTDTAGNTYHAALVPRGSSNVTSVIYYASNIAAATANNKVTVTFSGSIAHVDLRIFEYKGIDTTNPIDTTAVNVGTAATNTVSITTTNANDLLVAGNVITGATTAAGAGFTSRGITSPYGDIVEDKTVTAAGTYTATASGSGGWVMQIVAFRATGSGSQPPPPPPMHSATLSWDASTSTVVGYNVYRSATSGTGYVKLTSTLLSGLTYVDQNLGPGTYYYVTTAVDDTGSESAFSNQVIAVVPAQ